MQKPRIRNRRPRCRLRCPITAAPKSSVTSVCSCSKNLPYLDRAAWPADKHHWRCHRRFPARVHVPADGRRRKSLNRRKQRQQRISLARLPTGEDHERREIHEKMVAAWNLTFVKDEVGGR